MRCRLYFDHNVQQGVAEALKRLGVDVITAKEDGTALLPDEQLLARASALGRVLVTNDKDFTVIADRWRRTSRPFSGVAYMIRQDIPYAALIEDLHLIAATYTPEEMVNRVEYLPL